MTILKDKDLKVMLNEIKNWKYIKKTIKKDYSFKSYMESIEFINRLAIVAEEFNHHPDMIVGWCKVEVSYTSHDFGGVTQGCFEMAKKTNQIFEDL